MRIKSTNISMSSADSKGQLRTRSLTNSNSSRSNTEALCCVEICSGVLLKMEKRAVEKGLKVPCLFMITEVSIRCQKNLEVGIPAYTPQYTTGDMWVSIVWDHVSSDRWDTSDIITGAAEKSISTQMRVHTTIVNTITGNSRNKSDTKTKLPTNYRNSWYPTKFFRR